jgi:hypothetical protein
MFSEVFFTGLYSSLIGFLLAMGAQCYKSKCKEVSFCCIKIIRDTTAEEDIDIQQRSQNPITTQSLDRPNERL